MVESTENEQVDFDEENYMEEIDEDVEDQIEDRVSDENIEGGEEDDEDEEVNEDPRTEEREQDPLAENNDENEKHDVDEREIMSINEEEKEKHAELLALPPHGAEVFIGGLPRDTVEQDLIDHCEPIGEIFEIRFIKNKDTNESKGYAFVSFTTKDAAKKAIEELHNKEFKGKTLRCSISETKHRLFIGSIPKTMIEDDFRKVIEQTGPGVENIEFIKDLQDPSRNRGFAFVEYYNLACADYSRKKMGSADFKLDGSTPSVTWADPKPTSDHSSTASAQVKALYVKNIPNNTTSDQVRELFEQHGKVTKVVMPPSRTGSGIRDFAFIHYSERSSALKAVKEGEIHEINGQVLEVALAKPQSDKKPEGSMSHNFGVRPNYLPQPSYGGFASNPYGSMGAGYGVGAQQPMIYGRGAMPAGMQMVPMVLPDGQIGYVLQQPGMPMPPSQRPRRNDRNYSSGGRGGSNRDNDDRNQGRRYRPY